MRPALGKQQDFAALLRFIRRRIAMPSVAYQTSLPFALRLHTGSLSLQCGLIPRRRHVPYEGKSLLLSRPCMKMTAPVPNTESSVSPLAAEHPSESLPDARDLSTDSVDCTLLSPMMQHYVSTKRSLNTELCSGSNRLLLLMYRVGDFFESFFEDARLLSRVCDIALTSKNAGKTLGVRAPMAGIPHYCIDDKIKMLLSEGVSVAVVDQVETAAQTKNGKLVKRAVTRLVTPATAAEDALLDSSKSSYMAALHIKLSVERGHEINGQAKQPDFTFGFAYADVSTGEFRTTDGFSLDDLRRLVHIISPPEVVVSISTNDEGLWSRIETELRQSGVGIITRRECMSERVAENFLKDLHGVDTVESLGCRNRPLCVQAAAELVHFIKKSLATENSQDFLSLKLLTTFSSADFMILDAACVRNLELLETNRDGSKECSLQWAVDRTVTTMGARCLRSWIVRPSMSLQTISRRQNVVEALLDSGNAERKRIQIILKSLADLERLAGRAHSRRMTPRELRWLFESIVQLPALWDAVESCLTSTDREGFTKEIATEWSGYVADELLRLARTALNGLSEPAPSVFPSELAVHSGALSKDKWELNSFQIFRDGYCKELDEIRKTAVDPDKWIATLEEQERKRSGADNLRIRHVKNTGFVLRLPRTTGDRMLNTDPLCFAKLGYDRVQSTKAEMRFQCDALKERERSHNSAMTDIFLLELRLFEDLIDKVSGFTDHIRSLGSQIAAIDVMLGFAEVAAEKQYVRPIVLPAGERVFDVCEARHPVVEQMLQVGESFVANSFALGQLSSGPETDMIVLCGPNAAGKSCALRSIGLLNILAQIGCFVPARSAKISLCDRIFTRVGAIDDVARGQSTFQVEMAETACILTHASSSSLVLLDEIGRGTSTADGIAIAWSVAEHLSQSRQAFQEGFPRSMFVTHFHELNHFASFYENVQSFHVEVVKSDDLSGPKASSEQLRWISTHRIIPGASNASLGLAVAERAGFPESVVRRAEVIAGLLLKPSKLLGAELQNALSTNINPTKTSTQLQRSVAQGLHIQDQEALLQKGFEEGYKKAVEEVEVKLLKVTGSLLDSRSFQGCGMDQNTPDTDDRHL